MALLKIIRLAKRDKTEVSPYLGPESQRSGPTVSLKQRPLAGKTPRFCFGFEHLWQFPGQLGVEPHPAPASHTVA